MSNPRTLGPWLRRFLADHIVTERRLARNTQASYRDSFALLLPFVSAKARKPVDRLAVEDLTAGRVLQFLAHLERDRGCSAQTRNQRLAAIRSFARFVAGRDPAHLAWCAQIRALATKKAARQPISWMSRDEMEALLAVPDSGTPRGRIEHAVLLFLYNTGARVSEAAGLRVGDVETGRRGGGHALVTLFGKGAKSRQCPLWPRTGEVLKNVVRGRARNEAVFLSRHRRPYTRFGIYRLVERCAAGVPALTGRRITPHSIRHTSACHLLQAGVDINTIRAWLGHVSLETTNIYAEIDLAMKAKAMALCEAAKRGPGRPWKQDKGVIAFLKAI
ncbi:MAG: tyrosine-type recombinase/integrase [Alphaproteobacteria bacterium]|nr:tyrosine-type recombinase/integrase [Alphaproteobacteria bacterium]